MAIRSDDRALPQLAKGAWAQVKPEWPQGTAGLLGQFADDEGLSQHHCLIARLSRFNPQPRQRDKIGGVSCPDRGNRRQGQAHFAFELRRLTRRQLNQGMAQFKPLLCIRDLLLDRQRAMGANHVALDRQRAERHLPVVRQGQLIDKRGCDQRGIKTPGF